MRALPSSSKPGGAHGTALPPTTLNHTHTHALSPPPPKPRAAPVACVDRVERDYINNPTFRPESIRTKSSAAAGLCAWVINICKYFRIYQA